MDAKLIQRIQALGAILVGLAYFLPWASIMSPVGSIELRGLYVDYAWILLVLAILQLLLQFAKSNKIELGLSDQTMGQLEKTGRVVPFIFVAFFAWYGSSFGFNARNASAGVRLATLFGTSVQSVVKAGLDYGFWIGACGTLFLIVGLGLMNAEVRRLLSYAAVFAVTAVCVAFGFSRPGKQLQQTPVNESSPRETSGSSPNASANDNSPESNFDSSPFIRLDSVSGRVLEKNYDVSRYSNSIVISPTFRNTGSKAIVGLRGRLSVIDGFGKEVYGFNFRDDDRILPGRDSSRGGYSFEENQFEHDDPYHRMAPLISAGTAKYRADINRIAFDDGSVLPKD